MTVPSQTNKDQQAGNGVSTVYTVPFRILSAVHIEVLQTIAGVTTTLVLTTDYAVSGVGNPNTTVTFVAPPAVGTLITFLRRVPLTQETDYVPNDPFPAESHERALDKLTMVDQQQQERIDAALTLPPEAVGVSTTLPTPQPSTLFGWAPDGSSIQNYPFADIATNIAYGDKLFQTFVGNGAQTTFPLARDPGSLGNLDVSVDGVTQVNGADFTYLGTALTFAVAPSNLSVILVRFDVAVPIGTGMASAIQFQQSGAGAIVRSSQDKMREIVSVADFAGLDPTGVAASDAAFSAASIRAGLDGRVIIPPGTYKLGAANIGLISTSWIPIGAVNFTGAGSLNGTGLERVGNRFRFGGAGQFNEQHITFNLSTDYSQAQMIGFRTVTALTDRSGLMHMRVNNDADNVPTNCALFDIYHRGANTTGFPNAVTMYSTAKNLYGANVLANFMAVLSPAFDIPANNWNLGKCYAQEINFGNRWAELGLQRDHTLQNWCGGTVYAPDVLPGPDGGGTSYNFHAQYGILFGRGQNGGGDRRMWIPILIGTDSIPLGGIGIHTRGASSGNGPLAIVEAAGNWQKGVDMSPAFFSGGGPAFKGWAWSITNNGSQTEEALIYRAAPGNVGVSTNRQSPGNEKFFNFREDGRFTIASPTVPASAAAAGSQGDIAWDSNFIYVCIATNTWKRAAIATW